MMMAKNCLKKSSLSKLIKILIHLTFLHATLAQHKNEQIQTQVNSTETPPKTTASAIDSENAHSVRINDPSMANSGSPEPLASGNDFVDLIETPTIILDNTAGQIDNDTSPSIPESDERNPTISTISIQNKTAETISAAVNMESIANTTGSIETILSDNPTNIDSESTQNGTVNPPSSIDEISGEQDDGPLSGEAKLTEFEAPKNVSQYMDYIERLLHDLRHQITDLFEPHLPQLIRTSQMVQLSGSCSYDMLRMAFALRQFEPWALRMIDSSGKMPEGIFEGSFTALGSYDECLTTVFGDKSPQQQQHTNQDAINEDSSMQQSITKGKYCLVNVSPFLPPKPPADRVERMFQEEANRRNYTKDDQFSRLSPMFYYMKFRIGVCIPSTCIESDMDSISEALSSSLRLNITIPHCRVEQTLPVTKHQLAGGLIFGMICALVLFATILDCCRRRSDKMMLADLSLISFSSTVSAKNSPDLMHYQGSQMMVNGMLSNRNSPSRAELMSLDCSCDGNYSLRKRKFNERINENWSWLSFSLLTNFKLYFQNHYGQQMECLNVCPEKNPSESKIKQQSTTHSESLNIRCLDGIRVLSLCWVIVANSYITLDPRATKRLSVTREAPKDFFFQMIVQASLAIETFFFLSGILVSISFARRLSGLSIVNSGKVAISWLQFYVHRYIRITPATMLVIAFTMFAFRFGDGPLWFEATHKSHLSCSENWWRHLLHVANFIDTRQMCFIHYWYIAADMQLFLFAPILLLLLYKRPIIAYLIAIIVGLISVGTVFHTTYQRNLPPTLLFYSSDPESRREYGNSIMTKPLTHALPYLVGLFVGKWLSGRHLNQQDHPLVIVSKQQSQMRAQPGRSMSFMFGVAAVIVVLSEVFLPYKWNNSRLPTQFVASLYAALFRFCWSLALAYLVVSCTHSRDRHCRAEEYRRRLKAKVSKHHKTESHQVDWPMSYGCFTCQISSQASNQNWPIITHQKYFCKHSLNATSGSTSSNLSLPLSSSSSSTESSIPQIDQTCTCGSGGSLINRFLSMKIFTHLSKLSFVAYLIHLPLMSVFISQTRGLFAFSHTLVMHLALSYLVMTFLLSFLLVHIIEFPFITFERYFFERFQLTKKKKNESTPSSNNPKHNDDMPATSVDLARDELAKVMEGLSSKNKSTGSSRSNAPSITMIAHDKDSVHCNLGDIDGHNNERTMRERSHSGEKINYSTNRQALRISVRL